jgi:SAM-dependent methyltransferase
MKAQAEAALTSVSSHFAFGENWSSFAKGVGEDAVLQAMEGVSRLIGPGAIQGASFFDIGCGSGLSMLAAKRLGAGKVTGIDIDPMSVRTAENLLASHMPATDWSVAEKSVFDLDPARDGYHDAVYSWGVLHHTGSMWQAIRKSAALVKPGGLLILALYRKTPFCGFWKHEKRIYSKWPPALQAVIQLGYQSAYIGGLLATGRNPVSYIRNYRSNRGMDWRHDVHDWLGGYPYESASPEEVKAFAGGLGFTTQKAFEKQPRLKGFLGTHCDEFVFRRKSH